MYAHYQAQAWRFARLFIVALGSQAVLLGSCVSHDAVVAAIVAALETAYREFSPVTPPGV
ncbi:MAG: hypothetical protein ACREMY_08700 [bacterium]